MRRIPVRLERQLMERLEYHLLSAGSSGLWVDDPVWDRSVLPKLVSGEITCATPEKCREGRRMTHYPDYYKHAIFDVISDAVADPRCGASFTIDTLIYYLGRHKLCETLDTTLFDLLDGSDDLLRLADAIVETVYLIPDIDCIAPFDGTLRECPDEGETEEESVRDQDVLPFLPRWRDVLLGYKPTVGGR